MSHKPNRIVILLLLAFLYVYPNSASAQDCIEVLDLSSTYYNEGKFEKVIDLLSECRTSSDVNVRFAAHRQTARAYLALNRNTQAREHAVEMLRIQPDYDPETFDESTEMIRLCEKIEVIPAFSLGANVSLATNLTNPRIQRSFDVIMNQSRVYKGGLGLMTGIESVYQFSPNAAIYGYLLINQQNYTIESQISSIDVKVQDRLTYILLPMGFRYFLDNESRWTPFADIGFYMGRLISSNSSFSYSDSESGTRQNLDKIGTMDRRTKWVAGLPIGFGIGTEVNKYILSLRFAYLYSLSNSNNPDVRLDFPEISSRYFHVDDDLFLDSISIQLGVNIPLNYKVYN